MSESTSNSKNPSTLGEVGFATTLLSSSTLCGLGAAGKLTAAYNSTPERVALGAVAVGTLLMAFDVARSMWSHMRSQD